MSGDEDIIEPNEKDSDTNEEAPIEEEPSEEEPSEEEPSEEAPVEQIPVEEEPDTADDGESTPEEDADFVGPGLSKTAGDGEEETPEEILLSRLESLVFVSPGPISVRRLARILSLPGQRIRELLGVLGDHYENRGIVLQEVSGGFQFRTHADNAAVIRHVFKLKPLRMSRAALETLAIVAYRQPLTRAEVESIRGVDCGGVLKFLFEKELVRVIGRKEEPGRPIIYGTSQAFLELFGLKSLSDLPALHEFSELWDEHQEIVDEEAPLEEDTEDANQTDANQTDEDANDPIESKDEEGDDPAESDIDTDESDEDTVGADEDTDESDVDTDESDVDTDESGEDTVESDVDAPADEKDEPDEDTDRNGESTEELVESDERDEEAPGEDADDYFDENIENFGDSEEDEEKSEEQK